MRKTIRVGQRLRFSGGSIKIGSKHSTISKGRIKVIVPTGHITKRKHKAKVMKLIRSL